MTFKVTVFDQIIEFHHNQLVVFDPIDWSWAYPSIFPAFNEDLKVELQLLEINPITKAKYPGDDSIVEYIVHYKFYKEFDNLYDATIFRLSFD